MDRQIEKKESRRSHIGRWMMIGFILGIFLGALSGFGFAPAIAMCLGVFIGGVLDSFEIKKLQADQQYDPPSVTIKLT